MYAICNNHQLRKLKNEIKPDCVFTVFGSSYRTSISNHLMGYANPDYVYPEYLKMFHFSLVEHYLTLLKKQFPNTF
jgi:hypothetical protein